MATFNISVNSELLLTALAGTPASADSVYIDRYAAKFTSADLSGGAADLTLLELTSGFSGQFLASLGGQLKAVVNQAGAGIFRNGSNSPRVELVSTSSTGVIATVINKPASGGVLQLNTMKVTDLSQETGTCIVDSAVDLTNAYCYNGNLLFRETGSYALTALRVEGGVCNLQRDTAAVEVSGGECVFESSLVSPSGATIVDGSGRLTIVDSGTIASLSGFSGVLDLTRLRRKIIVATREFHPGLTVLMSKQTVVPTYSANTDKFGGANFVTV